MNKIPGQEATFEWAKEINKCTTPTLLFCYFVLLRKKRHQWSRQCDNCRNLQEVSPPHDMIDPFSINRRLKELIAAAINTSTVGATLASQPVRPNLENLERTHNDVHSFCSSSAH